MIPIKHNYVTCGLHDEQKINGWTLEDGTEILAGVCDGRNLYIGDVDLFEWRGTLRRFEAVKTDGQIIGFIERRIIKRGGRGARKQWKKNKTGIARSAAAT